MSPELHPSGFRIGSRAIAASFAHPASFQPLDQRPPDEYSLVSTAAVGGSDTGWCSYWDQTAFAEIQEFQVDQDVVAELTPSNPVEGEKKKEKKKERSKPSAQKIAESAGLTVLSDLGDVAVASTMPLLSKPLSLSLNKAGESDKKAVGGLSRPGASGGVFGDEEDPADAELGPDPSKPKLTVWKANPMMQGKKVFGNINKWNNAQGELSGKKQHEAPAVSTSPSLEPKQPEAAPSAPTANAQPSSTAEELPYGNIEAMTCLLCSKKFKTVDMLKRHSNESALHKTNLGKPELVEAAISKLETARQATTPAEAEDNKPKYRDRAAERRVALRQPDHPMPEQADRKRKWAEGPPAPAPPPPPPVIPAKDENNMGNKLLKKMGWSEGAGLGSSGDGRVNPVETAMYEQGVGLGASKAKEVTNFQGYREMARDSARDRYNATQ